MQPSFALEDPETFSFVLPWKMVTSEPSESKEQRQGLLDVPRNSAKLLQEKVQDNWDHLTLVYWRWNTTVPVVHMCMYVDCTLGKLMEEMIVIDIQVSWASAMFIMLFTYMYPSFDMRINSLINCDLNKRSSANFSILYYTLLIL